MLRTLPQTREYGLSYRLVAIVFFTVITAVSAQYEIRFGSVVPFTMQVFAVLLAGMVLGSRDGAASQALYVLLIRIGLPIAAGGAGASALAGPTAGYLIGFIPAAFLVGYLTEQRQTRMWQRLAASIVGIAVIYLFGIPVLKARIAVSWSEAWALGGAPFIAVDIAKAIFAASLSEGGRTLMLRQWQAMQQQTHHDEHNAT